MAPSVEVYSKDPGYVVAVCGKYLIHIVKDRTTNTTISLMRRAMTELSERHEKFGYLLLMEPEAPLLLAPDIRSGIGGIVKRFSPRFSGAAVVYEKTGFQATAIRSIVTAINFESRSSHPNHVFSNFQDSVAWLSKLTLGEPTATRLMQIVKELRQPLTAAAPPSGPSR